MAIRLLNWSVALVAATAGAALSPATTHPLVAPALFGLLLVTIGLASERVLRARRSRGTGQASTRLPRPLRPPGVEPRPEEVRGIDREANPQDPRFGRFRGLHEGSARKARRRHAPRASPPLTGKVVLVSTYLGLDGRRWSAAEVAGSLKAVERACRWLEGEAVRWNAALNVAPADTYFLAKDPTPDEVLLDFQAEGDHFGPFERDADFKLMRRATVAAVGLGFRDVGDWYSEIEERVDADATAWIFHLRQAGRSFALPRSASGVEGVSLAACYCREASFPEPLRGPARTDPVTVVHELLHLFGASDKYGRPLHDYPAGQVTAREVMRLSQERLSRLRIEEATAREIGWLPP